MTLGQDQSLRDGLRQHLLQDAARGPRALQGMCRNLHGEGSRLGRGIPGLRGDRDLHGDQAVGVGDDDLVGGGGGGAVSGGGGARGGVSRRSGGGGGGPDGRFDVDGGCRSPRESDGAGGMELGVPEGLELLEDALVNLLVEEGVADAGDDVVDDGLVQVARGRHRDRQRM